MEHCQELSGDQEEDKLAWFVMSAVELNYTCCPPAKFAFIVLLLSRDSNRLAIFLARDLVWDLLSNALGCFCFLIVSSAELDCTRRSFNPICSRCLIVPSGCELSHHCLIIGASPRIQMFSSCRRCLMIRVVPSLSLRCFIVLCGNFLNQIWLMHHRCLVRQTGLCLKALQLKLFL